MPGRASKPVRRVESRDTSFERLLDSDEAAALLKIHPKTLQKMARDGEITSTGRNDVSKEHHHWNFRGVPNGLGCPISRGCAPLNNQPADSAATSQERQFRDSCEALSGARTSGYFSPSEACPSGCGRTKQGLLDTVWLRDLFKGVDSPAAEIIPAVGGEGRRCRGLVKDVASGARQQGEDQKSHERLVLSRHAVGMDGEEPDQERAAKCQALQGARCAFARRNNGTPLGVAGTTSHCSGIGCIYGASSRRADRSPVARRRLRRPSGARSALGRDDGAGYPQD